MTETFAAAIEPKTTRDFIHQIIEATHEAKGTNLSLIDVSKLCDISDFFLVVSGRSDRQVQGISNRIIDAAQRSGGNVLSVEGLEEGQWVLIDLGELVVHVFYEATREYYDFDSLWARGTRLKISDDPDGKNGSRHAA